MKVQESDTKPMVTLIEHCRLRPPESAGPVPELSLRLTFLDARFIDFHPTQTLHFYEIPQPKTYFIETIIPSLKTSLSLTLKHFLPMAGNLIYTNDFDKPELCYIAGDSISLTFAECNDDFNYLSSYHCRNADRLRPLVPKLPPAFIASGTAKAPLFAVQVTVFPNSGFSVGCTSQHVLGDASTIFYFLKSWASINRFNGDAQFLASSPLPYYDRDGIKDPYKLLHQILNEKKKTRPFLVSNSSRDEFSSTNNVRATFVMTLADVNNLKNFVLVKPRNTLHLHASSFIVTCAYIWICWVKSLLAIGEKFDEDEQVYLICPADFRARLDPPLQPTYFGNCLVPCIAASKHGELVGSEGVSIAAALIGEAIRKRLSDREGIISGAWIADVEAMKGHRHLGIAGSAKNNIYDVDFGWGKAKKYESMSIDFDGAVSLNMSRNFPGGLEVGFSMPKKRTDALSPIFRNGLKSLSLHSRF